MHKFVVEALDPSSGDVVTYDIEAAKADAGPIGLGLYDENGVMLAGFSKWLNVRRTAVD